MSLYGDYIKERLNREIFETSLGFATYEITGEECYIVDVFIKEEARKTGHGSWIADKIKEIAKERGCKYLTGSVVPSSNGSTESTKALLAYGFKIHSSKDDFIIFTKEI
jgi:GNAT superfamily N-acetyltransferase